MRVLLVSNGFPPSGQWGTEFYTHQLATGLRARGHRVAVLCPDRERGGERFAVARSVRHGVELFEVHHPPEPRKRFADSYRSAGVEARFDALLAELRPDVVHFTHLLWGLSVGLPRRARAAGARVVVTLTDYGLLCHRGQLLGLDLEPCPGPEPARCARCIRSVGPYEAPAPLRLGKAALAHGLAAAGGLGLVVTPRDLGRRTAAVRGMLGAVDAFVAPTEVLARRFEEELGRDGAGEVPPIERLCYGLDEGPFAGAPARVPDGRLRLGFLGQFQPHKGLDVLLAAASRLRRSAVGARVPWELVLHGNAVGGRHRLYLGRTWDPSLADVVRFAGPFAPLEAPRAMARLDALVVPSVWTENAPLTVLQARAMGLPLIASDVPGVREVAARDAVLVPPGDAAALARALEERLRRGATARRPEPLPVAYDAHLARLERLYGAPRRARRAERPAFALEGTPAGEDPAFASGEPGRAVGGAGRLPQRPSPLGSLHAAAPPPLMP